MFRPRDPARRRNFVRDVSHRALAPFEGPPYASPRMKYVITIIGLILTLGILAGVKGAQISTLIGFGQQMQAMGPPPEAVNSARAASQEWENTLSAVGTVVSGKGVAVSNDAAGVVTRIYFESGASIKRGDPLVLLDASVERAQLESVQARLRLARQSLDRVRKLRASGVSTEAELDAQESSVRGLAADLRALQAQIERKTVRAPFDGRLGIREVNLGQYLPPGTPITALESLDSELVEFTLPQRDLPHIALGRAVRVRDEVTGPVIAEGSVSAFDSTVDPVTRTLKVRASVDGQGALQSGMFVNVEVILPEKSKVVAVPLTAVVRAAYGDSVFVIEAPPEGPPERRIARQQFVRVGKVRGDFVAIEAGVAPGQELVTAGAFKLRNGAPVAVKNEVGADPALMPRPVNN